MDLEDCFENGTGRLLGQVRRIHLADDRRHLIGIAEQAGDERELAIRVPFTTYL